MPVVLVVAVLQVTVPFEGEVYVVVDLSFTCVAFMAAVPVFVLLLQETVENKIGLAFVLFYGSQVTIMPRVSLGVIMDVENSELRPTVISYGPSIIGVVIDKEVLFEGVDKSQRHFSNVFKGRRTLKKVVINETLKEVGTRRIIFVATLGLTSAGPRSVRQDGRKEVKIFLDGGCLSPPLEGVTFTAVQVVEGIVDAVSTNMVLVMVNENCK